MHEGFDAPLGNEVAYGFMGAVIESEQIANDVAFTVGAAGVDVTEVCGHQIGVSKVVEDVLGCG